VTRQSVIKTGKLQWLARQSVVLEKQVSCCSQNVVLACEQKLVGYSD
jgi:hypothetical protein